MIVEVNGRSPPSAVYIAYTVKDDGYNLKKAGR